ncbi:MAG: zinc ribbon domain-containing protein [Spirochaetaceae bacterium]|nr:MAG: zinc ribbon domain-containing protein [Spirochaetaceae bacterium]
MTYEYRCRDCDQTFDVTATVAEKAAGLSPDCLKCGSAKVSQVFGGFGVLSGSRGGGLGAGSMCGPGSGCC